MGLTSIPVSAGPVKSIQRGVASTAGDITISAVDITKTIVNSFSTGSAGTAAGSGTINSSSGSTSGMSTNNYTGYATGNSSGAGNATTWPTGLFAGNQAFRYGTSFNVVVNYAGASASSMNMTIGASNFNAANISANAANISGGSTNLVTATYGIYLKDSTTITATGPCRYEVIEYY